MEEGKSASPPRSNTDLEGRENDAKVDTSHYDNGVYVGELKDGKRHGRGVCKCAKGDTYDGEWEDGIPHGRGVYKHANGNVYDGELKDDKMDGEGRFEWNDGDVYDGVWKNDLYHGVGTFTWTSGTVYYGEFVEGKQHGWGKQTLASGDVYEGQWVDGQLRGNEKEEGIGAKARARNEGTAPGASREKQQEKETRIYDERTLRSTQSQQRRLQRNETSKECEHCGVDDGRYKLRVCSGCNLALYCSAACQKAARGSHQRICDIVSELPSKDSEELSLTYDGEKRNDFDAWLRFATKYMPHLKHLNLDLTGMSAEDMGTTKLSSEKLSSFLRSKKGVLESVILVSCVLNVSGITRNGHDVWKEMRGLKQLHFERTSFDGVESLHTIIDQQKDTLTALTLPYLGSCWAPANCRQSLAQAVSSCKSLVKLDLQGCLLTDCDLKVLLRDLPHLRILDLRRNKCQTHEFTDKGCGIIARQCPSLQELNLDDHDRLSMKGIYQIFKGCVHLRYFLTTTRKLSRDDIRSLLDIAPQLVCLSLGRKHGIAYLGLVEIIEETGGRTVLVGGCENENRFVNSSMLSEKAKENYGRVCHLLDKIHNKNNRMVANWWEELWKDDS